MGFAIIAYHRGKFDTLAKDFEDDVADYEEFEKVLKRKNKDELIAMILEVSDWYPDMRHEFM